MGAKLEGEVYYPSAEVTEQAYVKKTRSGKIMRRVLKARAQGLPEGDVSTLDE